MDKWGPLKTLIALKNTFFYFYFFNCKASETMSSDSPEVIASHGAKCLH